MTTFISHATVDTMRAARVLRLLHGLGESNVFLDADPNEGLVVGCAHFATQLSKHHSASDLFVAIVTDAWLASTWCLAEYRAAQLRAITTIAIVVQEEITRPLPADVAIAQQLRWADPSFAVRLEVALLEHHRAQGREMPLIVSANARARGESLVFHERIRLAFERRGFKVTNAAVETSGLFNFFATKSEFGIVASRLAVSCWQHLHEPYDDRFFRACANEIRAAAAHHKVQGVIVCHARENVGDFGDLGLEGVHFSSLQQTESHSLRYIDYLEGCASRLYKSYLSRTFVDLDAIEIDPGRQLKEPVVGVANRIAESFLSNRKNFYFLIGEFGSGKTTIAEQVHRRIADAYRKGDTALFPMIFYLKTLAQADSHEKFVASQVTDAVREPVDDFLSSMRERGDLLVILDGFDEVASSSSDAERRGHFFNALSIAYNCSHVLITTRPSVFETYDEMNRLFEEVIEARQGPALVLGPPIPRDEEEEERRQRETRVVRASLLGQPVATFPADRSVVATLLPLDEDKILAFFEQRGQEIQEKSGRTPAEVFKRFRALYGVAEIITRPLLLEMVRTLLVDGRLDIDDPRLKVGAVFIYDLYLNMHLDREGRTSTFLDKADRLAFARAAALAMLENGGSLEATFDSVAAIVERARTSVGTAASKLLDRRFEQVVADVRVRGFLTVTPEGRVTFSHRSFMEFMVAEGVYQQVNAGAVAEAMNHKLEPEVLQFIGGFCRLRREFGRLLNQHIGAYKQSASLLYRMNFEVAKLLSDVELKFERFEAIDIEGVKLRGRSFSDCAFETVALSRATLDDVKFLNCKLRPLKIIGDLFDATFESCEGKLHLSGGVARLRVSRSELELRCDPTMNAVTLLHSRIALGEDQSVEFLKSTLERCVLSQSAGARLRLMDTGVRGVLFLGVAAQGVDDAMSASRALPVQIHADTLPDWAVFGWLLNPAVIADNLAALSKVTGIVVVDDRRERHSLQFGAAPPANPNWAEHGKSVFVSSKWFDKHHGAFMGLKREFERVAMEGGDFSKSMTDWRTKNHQVIGASDGKRDQGGGAATE